MTRSTAARLALLLVCGVALAACAPGPNTAADGNAGFWLGLWHGFICPFTFVVSLFNDTVNVYEVNNSGNWYNFGFVLGASVIFGGGGSGARGRRR